MANADPLDVLLASERTEDIKRCTVSLRGAFPGCRVEAAYSAAEMMQCVSGREWGVVLIDESFFHESDSEILADLRRHAPNTAVIVYTESDDKTRAAELAGAGVNYCLHRNSGTFFAELPIVMRGVMERSELRLELDLVQQRYDRLTERMTGFVYHLDHEGRFTHVSEAVASMLGHTAEELLGTHYLDLIHADDRASATNKFNEQRSGRRATNNMSVRLLPKNGEAPADEAVKVEFSAAGLYSGRTFKGTLGVVRDDNSRALALEEMKVKLQREFEDRQEQAAAAHRRRETELREEIQRREEALRQKQLGGEQQTKQFLDQIQALEEQLRQGNEQQKDNRQQLEERIQSLETQLHREQDQHLEQEIELNQRLQRKEDEFATRMKAREDELRQQAQEHDRRLKAEFHRQAEAFRQQQEVQIRELRQQFERGQTMHSRIRPDGGGDGGN